MMKLAHVLAKYNTCILQVTDCWGAWRAISNTMFLHGMSHSLDVPVRVNPFVGGLCPFRLPEGMAVQFHVELGSSCSFLWELLSECLSAIVVPCWAKSSGCPRAPVRPCRYEYSWCPSALGVPCRSELSGCTSAVVVPCRSKISCL